MGFGIREFVRLLRRRKLVFGSSTAVAIVGIAWVRHYLKKNAKRRARSSSTLLSAAHRQAVQRRKRGEINKDFFKNLVFLLKIVLPGWKSKEALLLILHTSFLVTRTFVSIYVAKLDGALVKNIVDPNGKLFLLNLLKWLALAVPATYINSMIRFLESKLGIAFRTRLVTYLYDLYMSNDIYYRVGNLDSRMANADQLLTEDAAKFCSNLAHLYSQLSKPCFDVLLMGTQLFILSTEQAGAGRATLSTILAFTVVFITAKALQVMSPPFGRLVSEQAVLEGELRYVHSRLITNSEEIAFYGGHEVEKSVLQKSYFALVKHMNRIFRARIAYNTLEGFFMKYVWSACGLVMIAIPSFFGKPVVSDANATTEDDDSNTISGRTGTFITSRKLLLDAAEAIERIMLAYKEITELSGYTARVTETIKVFTDLKQEKYQKHVVKQNGEAGEAVNSDILQRRGKQQISEHINFENVPIVSPNGDVLVEALSYQVKPGEHLLITGPNGCGKSSMFRILGGLWPVYGGSVHKPLRRDMFYIPQRPYLSLGNLRDQIIYPDTSETMKAKGITDSDLEDILGWVNLRYILEREGGWEAVKDWQDMFSGGEKQRIGMARLFYHKPKYAILDECTSAVSIDVEGKMYTHATDIGITLLTVTHRPSLWKYHNYLLQFDGEGGWKFSQLNAETRLSLKEEKSKLEASLAGVPKMQTRLRELCMLLGEDSCELTELKNKQKVEEEEVVEEIYE